MKKKAIITLVLMGTAVVLTCAFKASAPWLAPKDAESKINPVANDPEATKAGATIFKKNCEICHGAKGKGDGPAGMGLQIRPANLSSEVIQKNTDGAFFWKISNGRAPMPAFKSMLTDQQRWQVVNFVKTLGKK